MNNEELILVTGATGFLGVQLVRELLERQPKARLALLIRDRAGQSGQQRADLIVPPAERSRVQVYSGDVSQPNCGLETAAYQRLSAETTRVIHSAATVRFDHSLEEARQINVEGTRRMLDFAAGMRQLRSLAYVGTAYVAGERTDLVRESELAVGQSYRNTYEQTKAEAEALVRSRLGSSRRHSAAQHYRGRFAHRGDIELQDDVLAAKDLRAAAVAHSPGLSRRRAGHCAGGFRGQLGGAAGL